MIAPDYGRPEYKKYVQLFKVKEEIPKDGAAFGERTEANPVFNPGKHKMQPQFFIKSKYLDRLEPIDGSLEEMTNTKAPDISSELLAMKLAKGGL